MMKTYFAILIFTCISFFANAQQKDSTQQVPDKKKQTLIVDAACGQCKLGLAGSDCDLAVRINGQTFYVDGTKIDDHGDAHAEDGFCNAVRKAKVQGKVVNNRFQATYFKLIPATSAKKQSN